MNMHCLALLEQVPFWFWRMALAAVLGGLIGLEREAQGRPAGLRTHLLVCLGATLVTLGGEQLVAAAGLTQRLDTARIPAAVITGIGFLGAGSILRSNDGVRGLTTAAALWFAAGMGVVIGMGFYPQAIIATIMALAALFGLRGFQRRRTPASRRELVIIGTGPMYTTLEQTCRTVLAPLPIYIEAVETDLVPTIPRITLTFRLNLRGSGLRAAITPQLAAIAGVRRVSWRLPRDTH